MQPRKHLFILSSCEVLSSAFNFQTPTPFSFVKDTIYISFLPVFGISHVIDILHRFLLMYIKLNLCFVSLVDLSHINIILDQPTEHRRVELTFFLPQNFIISKKSTSRVEAFPSPDLSNCHTVCLLHFPTPT